MIDRQSSPSETILASLPRRRRAEARFRIYGIAAIGIALAFLILLISAIGTQGIGAISQTEIALDVTLDESVLGLSDARDRETLSKANYRAVIRAALGDVFPEAVSARRDRRALMKLVSVGAGFELRNLVLEDPGLVGGTMRVWVPADDEVDMLMKGATARDSGRFSDKQLGWLDQLEEEGRIRSAFNWRFFTSGDSREPELAGILGAIAGSFFALITCLVLSFPLGVMTAIYLEEFAPRNRWTDLIEININNLAAVPSIVFGLLGLAIFLGFMGLTRSAPLVGGMVLALMTLPTVIIATRASLRAVPPSIREAAIGLGASRMQAMLHHTLPLAMPGIMTGTIIGMAQALGESAPLIMIGMVAFIVDMPQGLLDPASALPVQIYIWADSPERAFAEKTAAAIIVLLAFLIIMNLTAVILRRRFERRW
ncbi:MAG: phosphate ABC transporter permease PstA [Alphaproteobacteria bacterium]|nr:phosphate ABC transporter permease PstA [Alphaproteobacteria bacterium]